jgi:hypothetical protein
MPTRGTDPRRVRGIDDPLWEDYARACSALYGTDNRSEIIRRHIAGTVARWRAGLPPLPLGDENETDTDAPADDEPSPSGSR